MTNLEQITMMLLAELEICATKDMRLSTNAIILMNDCRKVIDKERALYENDLEELYKRVPKLFNETKTIK